MSNYAIMRTAKVKSVASMANLEKHCTREKMPSNANPDLTKQNQDLLPDSLTLPERFAEMTDGQKIRKNAVLGVEVMMTYTPKAVDGHRLEQWTDMNRKWLESEFGKDNVVRLWLHMDESTPHLHAFVIPLDDKGKLNCRAYLGGAAKLSAMQDRYAAAMQQFDLERGIKGSKAQHKTVKEFYRAIEGANRQNLPKPMQKTEKGLFGANKTITEPIEDYYERANVAFREQGMQIVDLKEQLRKERTGTWMNKVNKAELERSKPKAEAWDRLKKGLDGMDDKNHAQDLKTELQGILDAQEARELSKTKAMWHTMDSPIR